MARIEKDGTKIYQTEDKQYKVKEQLLNTMFDCIHGLKDIIVTADRTDPYGDPRFDALTLFLTTFTLSEEECLSLIALRDDMLEDAIDESDSDSIQNRKTYNVNIKIIAKCMSNFDNYFGIKKRQEIMRVESPAIKKAKEEYGGDDYLGMMFAGGYNADAGEVSDD